MKGKSQSGDKKQTIVLRNKGEWLAWLEKEHTRSSGVWLRLAKKSSGVKSVSYDEAVDAALCFGWIDGQGKSDGENYWLLKFTPRGRRSIWSKRNRAKAIALMRIREMRPAGIAEVQRAKEDGRWDATYDGPRHIVVPEDLQSALSKNASAKAFFEGLDGKNRYAILFRIQTAKKPETRAKRIRTFVEMLARNEKLYA
jgi:uncharacterized protein YdeI (YjbR/CyaY-like superfamily)